MNSYSSSRGFISNAHHFWALYQMHRSAQGRMHTLVRDAKDVERELSAHFGVAVSDLDMLEIGPGQFLAQASYFALRNRVVCLDNDVIVRGVNPIGYFRMLRRNGPMRTAKTIARKLTGVDRRFRKELCDALHVETLPQISVRVGDVVNSGFEDATFDFVYSRSVLHQLSNPGRAISEISRILKPGGFAYISVHPWTSEKGCLDPRIYGSNAADVLGWPHLSHDTTVLSPNVSLNRLRISDWEKMFSASMADATFILTPGNDSGCLQRAKDFQAKHRNLDYSLEELTAGDFACLWRKPSPPA